MKKMKKRLLVGTAAALTAVSFSACLNRPTAVYGPPPEAEKSDISSSFDPEENIPETVYGPPEWFEGEEFDPVSNIPEDVYGPPSDFESEP